MKQWFVVYAQAMKEQVAERNLLNQGFECYLPTYRKKRRHARRVEEVDAPLFPRYLFVGMDPEVAQWRSINGTMGVAHLVCVSGRPQPVDATVIEMIRCRENESGQVVLDGPTYAKGQKMRVLKGPFEDAEGIFQEQDDKQRAMLLLNLLGRQVRTCLPLESIAAA